MPRHGWVVPPPGLVLGFHEGAQVAAVGSDADPGGQPAGAALAGRHPEVVIGPGALALDAVDGVDGAGWYPEGVPPSVHVARPVDAAAALHQVPEQAVSNARVSKAGRGRGPVAMGEM